MINKLKTNKTETFGELPSNISVIVFDVDNTIIKGTTVAHSGGVTEVLSLRNTHTLVRAIVHNMVYNIFSIENGIQFIKNKGLSILENYPSENLKKNMQKNLQQKIDSKLYPEIVESIEKHRLNGKTVILASAAPDFLVKIVADKVKADYYIGTILDESNGVFTGKTIGEINHGNQKAINVTKLLEKLNIPKSELAAVTDSTRDIALLEIADYKMVVNPDFKLRKSAKKNNWKIVDLSPRHKVLQLSGVVTVTGLGVLVTWGLKNNKYKK